MRTVNSDVQQVRAVAYFSRSLIHEWATQQEQQVPRLTLPYPQSKIAWRKNITHRGICGKQRLTYLCASKAVTPCDTLLWDTLINRGTKEAYVEKYLENCTPVDRSVWSLRAAKKFNFTTTAYSIYLDWSNCWWDMCTLWSESRWSSNKWLQIHWTYRYVI